MTAGEIALLIMLAGAGLGILVAYYRLKITLDRVAVEVRSIHDKLKELAGGRRVE